jgi:DNA-directed RNA polymerase specialized sigma24 family protein
MPTDPREDKVCCPKTRELQLAQTAARGSENAWREFLLVYAGLILDMVRRHLPHSSEDEVRDVYVDLLTELHDGGLAKYRGQSQLSTWLFVFAKRRVVDYWRSRRGRYRDPVGAARLSGIERDVLQLYYIERYSMEVVVHMLNGSGKANVNATDIVNAIERIEETVDGRFLKRVDRENGMSARGRDSVRFLEYLVRQRVEYEARVSESAPDAAILKREAAQTAARVSKTLAGLSEEERRVVEMRFDRRMRAREISDQLKLNDPRKVYTILERALRQLRRAM